MKKICKSDDTNKAKETTRCDADNMYRMGRVDDHESFQTDIDSTESIGKDQEGENEFEKATTPDPLAVDEKDCKSVDTNKAKETTGRVADDESFQSDMHSIESLGKDQEGKNEFVSAPLQSSNSKNKVPPSEINLSLHSINKAETSPSEYGVSMPGMKPTPIDLAEQQNKTAIEMINGDSGTHTETAVEDHQRQSRKRKSCTDLKDNYPIKRVRKSHRLEAKRMAKLLKSKIE
jgi:hypothetical protein